MTFTYNVASLTSDLAQVRLEIGDTVSASALFQDEELNVFLADEGSVLGAAARACEALAARFARGYRFKTDDQEFDRSKLSAQYAEQAKCLRIRAGGTTTVVPTRVDGYSQDIANDETASTSAAGRVRAGYTNPDLPS